MPRRIDIDGGDPQNEIEEALRQLTQRQKTTQQPDQELVRAVQEVAEQQKVEAVRVRKKREPRSRGTIIAWAGIFVVVVGLVLAVVLFAGREPPPPPARSPEEAVEKFWGYLIQEKYEAAITYYPQLQSRYGSAAQAGAQLQENLRNDPPTSIKTIGPSEQLNEKQYRVPYVVYKRSGQPSIGEFIVNDTGMPSTGFIIASGWL